jgi:RecA-family ATPase
LPLELELAAARVVSPKNVIQTDLKDIDTTKTIDEAKAYLINEAPEAITGQRGNDTTYRVAARAMDIGVSPGVAFELMWGFWNDSKAMPPWSAAELTRIVENAGRYRQQPIGVANPAVEFEEVIKAERERAETAGLPWYDIAGWDGSEPPERLWAVLDLVPRPQVGLFSGAGGGGKSIIELTRNVAHVTGSEWFGHTVTKGGAFYLGCEDDADEIWRRLAVIARHYGVSFQQLDKLGLKILPLLGEDAVLAKWDAANQKMRPTALYEALLSEARRHRPANISIDPLARAFAGNEIERTQVYQFAQLLQKLALTSGGSVTVLAHPSLQGMASGSGISGSTAWHDAFRFRMFLRGMKAGKDDEEDITGDLRNLEFLKNQYGRKGTTLKLKWTAGMFTPVVDSEAERLARQGWADDVFLDLLARFEREGRYVNNTPHSPGLLYAPKGFVGEPEATNHRLSAADLKGAMDRLFRAEKIHVGERKAGGHKRSCLMLGAGPKAK